MKVSLVGFYNSGKTTIFNAITGQSIETKPNITSSDVVHRGLIRVEDFRLNKISELINPRKITPAYIECIDPSGFIKGNNAHNSQILRFISDSDLYVYILRGFDTAVVPYQFDHIEPQRDFNELEYEFLILDLDLVTKRIERMIEQKKKGQRINEKEMEILKFISKNLENYQPIRAMGLNEEELKEIRHLSFFTIKPYVAVINADEKFIMGSHNNSQFLIANGELEAELIRLTDSERAGFLEAYEIDMPLSTKLCRKIYETLKYITFFTIVSDELRAWSIKRGTIAWDAAGKIHSDIQRGFIKAEVISFEDFILVNGDIGLAKHKGVLRFEGRDYEIQDGEIVTFRFKI